MDVTRKVWSGCTALSAFAILTALSAPAAGATEVATRLDYRAAPGCPGAEDFAAAVAGRLGYRPFRKDASQRVVVRVDPDGKGLEGRLEWRDAGGGWIGEQTLPSRTGNCAELVRAMGFALAVQFQLMATMIAEPRPPPTPPGPARVQAPGSPPSPAVPPAPSATPTSATTPAASTSGTPTPPPTQPPPQPPAATPPPPAAATPPETVTREGPVTSSSGAWSGPSLTVGAGAGVAFGAAPSVVPLGRLFGEVGWTHVVIELAGEISSLSTRLRDDGAGFSHRQVLGSLAGCGLVRPWGACLVGKAGEIRVAGEGVDVPATPTALMIQTGVRLTWTHMLGDRFQISAQMDGLALVTEGKVTVDSMPIWTTPRFTASFGVNVGVRFR